jgi:hypothetical protein
MCRAVDAHEVLLPPRSRSVPQSFTAIPEHPLPEYSASTHPPLQPHEYPKQRSASVTFDVSVLSSKPSVLKARSQSALDVKGRTSPSPSPSAPLSELHRPRSASAIAILNDGLRSASKAPSSRALRTPSPSSIQLVPPTSVTASATATATTHASANTEELAQLKREFNHVRLEHAKQKGRLENQLSVAQSRVAELELRLRTDLAAQSDASTAAFERARLEFVTQLSTKDALLTHMTSINKALEAELAVFRMRGTTAIVSAISHSASSGDIPIADSPDSLDSSIADRAAAAFGALMRFARRLSALHSVVNRTSLKAHVSPTLDTETLALEDSSFLKAALLASLSRVLFDMSAHYLMAAVAAEQNAPSLVAKAKARLSAAADLSSDALLLSDRYFHFLCNQVKQKLKDLWLDGDEDSWSHCMLPHQSALVDLCKHFWALQCFIMAQREPVHCVWCPAGETFNVDVCESALTESYHDLHECGDHTVLFALFPSFVTTTRGIVRGYVLLDECQESSA